MPTDPISPTDPSQRVLADTLKRLFFFLARNNVLPSSEMEMCLDECLEHATGRPVDERWLENVRRKVLGLYDAQTDPDDPDTR